VDTFYVRRVLQRLEGGEIEIADAISVMDKCRVRDRWARPGSARVSS
jgi:hypothetical protein